MGSSEISSPCLRSKFWNTDWVKWYFHWLCWCLRTVQQWETHLEKLMAPLTDTLPDSHRFYSHTHTFFHFLWFLSFQTSDSFDKILLWTFSYSFLWALWSLLLWPLFLLLIGSCGQGWLTQKVPLWSVDLSYIWRIFSSSPSPSKALLDSPGDDISWGVGNFGCLRSSPPLFFLTLVFVEVGSVCTFSNQRSALEMKRWRSLFLATMRIAALAGFDFHYLMWLCEVDISFSFYLFSVSGNFLSCEFGFCEDTL